MIAELGRADVVTGVADTADVVDPQLRQRISSGRTLGYAPGSQINVEGVAAAHPDVLVSAGMDESAYPKLRDAGVSVLADAEWLEATPLGRAEWIKVLAALTGTEKKAGEVYGKLRDDYAAVARKSAAPAGRGAVRSDARGHLVDAGRRRLRRATHPETPAAAIHGRVTRAAARCS